MKRLLCLFLPLLMLSCKAPTTKMTVRNGVTVITVSAGSSSGQIQSALNNAPSGSVVSFAPGTYNITGQINVPNNLTLTGAEQRYPATAILHASFSNGNIFSMNNPSGVTIKYLGFQNSGGIYIQAPASNITIVNNQFSGIPAAGQGKGSGVYMQGSRTAALNNINITWNNFGGPNDCNGVMSQTTDQGGVCNGIMWQAATNGLEMDNNTFYHLENGIKLVCVGSCEPPNGITEKHVHITGNDFNYIHSIAIELQPQPTEDMTIMHNSAENFVDGYWSTMGFSHPCCDTGATVPGMLTNDNVIIANFPPHMPPSNEYIPFGVEFWGNGSQANGNLIEGYWADGIAFGWGQPPWYIRDNYFCGPNMAKNNSYITDEYNGKGHTPPIQSGNRTSPSCSVTVSTAPVIAQSTTAVTMTDTGTNHSIYYTTDGSTPTTSSALYTGPFTPATNATVKAIGMWGTGANAKSYPAGYGYVPSAVVSAVYTGGGQPAGVLVTASLAGGMNTTVGGSIQLTATGHYSDGSNPVLPASKLTWVSSSPAVATVASTGVVTGVSLGTVAVTASMDSVTSTPFVVTITKPSVPMKSAYLAAPNNTNQLAPGQTLQFTVMGVFADGTTASIPNISVAWQSSNAAVMSIAASGLATAVGPGTASINGIVGSIKSSRWDMTVSAVTPVTIPLTPGIWKITVPAGSNASATGVGITAVQTAAAQR